MSFIPSDKLKDIILSLEDLLQLTDSEILFDMAIQYTRKELDRIEEDYHYNP